MSVKECNEYFINNDYPVDVQSNVPPELRNKSPNSVMPAHVPNGGLYRGPQINKWFVPHEATPTTTYFHRVLQANVHPSPPSGATLHYASNQRMGNNYVSMPGVNWYNSAYPRNSGPFNIKVSDPNLHKRN